MHLYLPGEYYASADPACLELLVCECGLVCGKGFGDGGAEHPGLDEVAKFFKNVVAGCVVGNDDGVPGDAAIIGAAVPAGGGDGSAVADSRNDELVQGGAVDEPVHAVGRDLSDALRHIVTAGDNVIGSATTYQCFIGGLCIGDHLNSVMPTQFDDILPEGSGGAGHRDR